MAVRVALLWVMLSVQMLYTTAAGESDIDAALVRASHLENEGRFDEVLGLLAPYADAGNPDVAFSLASSRMNLAVNGRKDGEVAPEDIQPAIDAALLATRLGSKQAWNLLWLIHVNGWGVPVDHEKAMGYLMTGVEAGEPGARLNHAAQLYEGTDAISQDVAKACVMFDELAADEQALPVVSYYLGQVMLHGQCGHEEDTREGMRLIKVAADSGLRDAERTMGMSHEYGWVDPADIGFALEWFGRAAEHGDPYSQWRIGMAWVNGEFGQKDPGKAFPYFEQSAASGDANGLTSLAVMYATGEGVARDSRKAMSFYEDAVDAGGVHALKNLAGMYATGEGVQPDLVRARLLYLRSIELGDPESPPLRQLIESDMDDTQLSESDRKFEVWKAQLRQ
jgi:TPR repeat protein